MMGIVWMPALDFLRGNNSINFYISFSYKLVDHEIV